MIIISLKNSKPRLVKTILETNLKNKKLKQQNKDLESKLKVAEELIKQNQQEIAILCEQLETKQLVDKIETKRQQLINLKQKLLGNNQTTESELNNLCQLQKEL